MRKNLFFLRTFVIILLCVMIIPSFTFALENANLPRGTIALYLSSNRAYVNNVEHLIDPDNKSIMPILQNNRTLLPVRFVSENFGYSVQWDSSTKKITIKNGTTTLVMQLNSKIMYKNGVSFTNDVAPFLKDNRTYVPIRVLSENLGKNVFYDRKLIIVSEKSIAYNTQTDKAFIDQVIKKFLPQKKLTIEEIAAFDKSVVVVYSFDSNGEPLSQGSGFYLGEGVIVTNYHVIDGASEIIIETEDNKIYEIEGAIASDIITDLVMLKTKVKPGMPALQLGLNRTIVKGQQIVTISSPAALKNTVSVGIISGLRNYTGTEMIQISAPITNGSSGGPLFDMFGNVIGVISSGIDAGSLNFAVSANHLFDWLNRISGEAFGNIAIIGNENYVKDSSISDTEIRSVLDSVVRSFNNEDIFAYQSNFQYKNAEAGEIEKEMLSSLFDDFNIVMKLEDIRIIKKTNNETLVRTTASYEDGIGGSDFPDQTTSDLYYLRKYDTKWKVFKVDTESYISFEEDNSDSTSDQGSPD